MDDLTNVTVDNTPTRFPRIAKHLTEVDPDQLNALDATSKTFYDHCYDFSAVPTKPTSLAGVDSSEKEVCKLTVTAPVASEYAVKTLQVLTGSDAVLEVQSFTVTAACSSSGDLTVDGDTVAVLDTDDAAAVAGKIRAASLTNWTTSGSGADVILTAKTYDDKAEVVLNAGGTGTTFSAISEDTKGTTTAGNITITLEGPGAVTVAISDGDDVATVVASIDGETYTGWTTSVDGDTVTFTCDTYGPKTGSFVDTDSTGVTVATGDLVDDNVGVDASGNVTVTLDGTPYVTALAIDDDTVEKVATAIGATSYGAGWSAGVVGDVVTFTAVGYGDASPDISFADTDTTGAAGTTSVETQGLNQVTVTWTDVGPASDSYKVYYKTSAAGTETQADILGETEFTGTKNPLGTDIPAAATKIGFVVAGVNEVGTGEYTDPVFVDIV